MPSVDPSVTPGRQRNLHPRKRYAAEFETAFLDRLRVMQDRLPARFEQQLIEGIQRSALHWSRCEDLRLLLALILETGGLLRELCCATWHEWDVHRRLWNVPSRCPRFGSRTVPLSPKALETLTELRQRAAPGQGTWFAHLGNERATAQQLRQAARRVDLGDYSFHRLRREAICRMVQHRRSATLREVMLIAGASPNPPCLTRQKAARS